MYGPLNWKKCFFAKYLTRWGIIRLERRHFDASANVERILDRICRSYISIFKILFQLIDEQAIKRQAMELSSRSRWRLIRPKRYAVVFLTNWKVVHYMHGNILFMFDGWANPVVHLLLLKSSIDKHNTIDSVECLGYNSSHNRPVQCPKKRDTSLSWHLKTLSIHLEQTLAAWLC